MGKSLAPSPMAMVCVTGMLLSAAILRSKVRFWAASMMGLPSTSSPVRVWVVSSTASYQMLVLCFEN
jgi:hypothetical protein